MNDLWSVEAQPQTSWQETMLGHTDSWSYIVPYILKIQIKITEKRGTCVTELAAAALSNKTSAQSKKTNKKNNDHFKLYETDFSDHSVDLSKTLWHNAH